MITKAWGTMGRREIARRYCRCSFCKGSGTIEVRGFGTYATKPCLDCWGTCFMPIPHSELGVELHGTD